MPVSETPRTRMTSPPSPADSVGREVTIGRNDTVVGENAKTKEFKRIDLAALNEETPIVKALVGTHRIGDTIPIKRGNKEILWRFILRAIESTVPKG